jgi:hypothetical protein
MLEEKALEDDEASIEKLHPFLLQELDKLGTSLESYYRAKTDGEPVKELTADILREHLQQLAKAMEDFDSDRADEITEELCGYHAAPQLEAQLEKLKEQEFALDFEACQITIREIEGTM